MTDPYGGFPLPTDTPLVNLESRQYRLFKLDLGEGIPRKVLAVGAWVFPPWLLGCYLVGVPVLKGVLIYLLPPVLLLLRATSRDAGGRLRLRAWGDRLWWVIRRHRPIVNGGTAPARARQPISTPITFMVLDGPEQDRPSRKGRRRAQEVS